MSIRPNLVRNKTQVRQRYFKALLKELKFVQLTMSEGREFHNLTVDIKYEQEKETVLAKGCNNCLL